jgi:hypothetical protein
MKKGLSILFALVIMLSGAHFTVATHFCGGKVAASKVSLSGKLASCGMEGTEESCPVPGNHLTTHCCDDQFKIIGIVDNFTAPVSLLYENPNTLLQIFYVPASQSFSTITTSNNFYTNFNPPGRFLANAVSLNDICVFRI